MNRRTFFTILVALLMCLPLLVVQAQSAAPSIAFVNGSGQLVVASADGATRWIVTNPGEMLHPVLGYAWSPQGDRLFFAVDGGGLVSLRVGELRSQSAREIGQVSGALSGGEWTPDGTGVLVADANGASLYPADGSGPVPGVGAAGAALISPFSNTRLNLPEPAGIAPNGDYFFYHDARGFYHTGALFVSDFILPGVNDPGARNSGLWADSAPLVAYWGYDQGSTALSVTNAQTGETLTLNSGTSIPIWPLLWQPGSTRLVFQNATEFINIADLGCLLTACQVDPLNNGTPLALSGAADVQIVNGWAFYRLNEDVRAVNLNCAQNASCVDGALTLASSAAPQTWIHVVDDALVYTAYAADARNPNDREVRHIDLVCLNTGTCQPRTLLAGAVAGLISPDGAYVVVDVAGNGLNALNMSSLSLTPLSGAYGTLGAALVTARWN